MDDPAAACDVDAVITWVQGDDPAHQARLRAWLGERERGTLAAAAPTRFNDCGEIEYCVASLLRFAPWLRTIFIVTDRQVPALVQTLHGSRFEARVRVVDHREIFTGFEAHLPTFSNRSIESLLWRIPGLAERFLYLNDDFQLIQPVAPGDFFHAQGVVLRGQWRARRGRRWLLAVRARLPEFLRFTGVVARPGNHSAQQLSGQMAGFAQRYFQAPHCPHPMRRSTIARYFEAHPAQLERNVSYRLRSVEQFLTVSLANHLELAAGSARIDNRLRPLRLKPDTQGLSSLRRQLRQADADPSYAFACVQSLDLAGSEARALLLDWLARRVGRLPDLL